MEDSPRTPGPANSGQDRPHGGDGKFLRHPDTAERDARASRMRVEGHTYDSIAREMGYASRGHAFTAVERALRMIIQEPVENLRKIQLDRLEEAHQVVRSIMRAEHVAHSGGKIVYMLDPDTGREVPVIDHGPNLAAADRVTRIAERVAKLTGTDEPTKIQDVTLDAVRAKIAAIKAKQHDAERDPEDP